MPMSRERYFALKERNKLIEQAKAGSKRAAKALDERFHIRVLAESEIRAVVEQRPELETKATLGKGEWNMLAPNS